MEHYRVTKDELEWLSAQVKEFGRVVHEVCSERIEKLKADAKARPDKVRSSGSTSESAFVDFEPKADIQQTTP